jgi:hypothetical protein
MGEKPFFHVFIIEKVYKVKESWQGITVEIIFSGAKNLGSHLKNLVL